MDSAPTPSDCAESVLSFEKDARFRLIFPVYTRSKKRKTLSVNAFLHASSPLEFALDEVIIRIGHLCIKPRLSGNTAKRATRHICRIAFSISLEDTRNLSIHSKVFACIPAKDGSIVRRGITYNVLLRRHIAAHGSYLIDEEQNTSSFFRQSQKNFLIFTVRHRNVTDTSRARIMLFCAFVLSRILPFGRPVLVFEKNASGYEESGKVIFEALINRGYSRVFFVISKHALRTTHIDKAYLPLLLIQHSFKHYYYFFKSRTYIGTETLLHALELRTYNPFVSCQLENRNSTVVFLQHGVMYMVSLDSPERKTFLLYRQTQ